MPIQVLQEDGKLTIRITGEFNYRAHQEFRHAYELAPAKSNTRFVVDFKETSFMESSAFGMLLLLLEHAGGERSRVHLLNSHGVVRKLLQVAHFQDLFTMDG